MRSTCYSKYLSRGMWPTYSKNIHSTAVSVDIMVIIISLSYRSPRHTEFFLFRCTLWLALSLLVWHVQLVQEIWCVSGFQNWESNAEDAHQHGIDDVKVNGMFLNPWRCTTARPLQGLRSLIYKVVYIHKNISFRMCYYYSLLRRMIQITKNKKISCKGGKRESQCHLFQIGKSYREGPALDCHDELNPVKEHMLYTLTIWSCHPRGKL